MPLVPNNTKRKMQAGEVALGFGVHHLRTAAAPALAAATGHDWLFLDNEHGAFSVSEIAQLCIASLPTGVTPLVRVCANAIDEATRALDNGALGIVMPHVDTAKEARRIAEAFRYPPQGRRSWGGPPAVYGYQPPADGRGAEGDQRRDPDRRDDRKPRGGEERRRHRRGGRHRRAAHRHLGPVVGTRHRRPDGPSEDDRRLCDRRRGLQEARQGAGHGRRVRRGECVALRRHGRAVRADRLRSQLHRDGRQRAQRLLQCTADR